MDNLTLFQVLCPVLHYEGLSTIGKIVKVDEKVNVRFLDRHDILFQ